MNTGSRNTISTRNILNLDFNCNLQHKQDYKKTGPEQYFYKKL